MNAVANATTIVRVLQNVRQEFLKVKSPDDLKSGGVNMALWGALAAYFPNAAGGSEKELLKAVLSSSSWEIKRMTPFIEIILDKLVEIAVNAIPKEAVQELLDYEDELRCNVDTITCLLKTMVDVAVPALLRRLNEEATQQVVAETPTPPCEGKALERALAAEEEVRQLKAMLASQQSLSLPVPDPVQSGLAVPDPDPVVTPPQPTTPKKGGKGAVASGLGAIGGLVNSGALRVKV